MKTPNQDPLYEIFEEHLHNTMVEEANKDEFVQKVVKDYLLALRGQGVVPQRLTSVIEDDLKEEVLEMLRKKTYGHHNIQEYRKKLLPGRTRSRRRTV